MFEYAGGAVAIAHNGNLVNADELRAELEAQGSIFQTSSDTEVIVHLMAKAREPDVVGKLIAGAARACAARTRSSCSPHDEQDDRRARSERLPPARDRPPQGRVRAVERDLRRSTSIEAEFIREVEPGEIVVIEQGRHDVAPARPSRARRTFCVFEHVYFARPD